MGMTLKNAIKKPKITSTGVPMKVVEVILGFFIAFFNVIPIIIFSLY
jgi:hypothetical protein